MNVHDAIKELISGIVCGLIDSQESLDISLSSGPNSLTVILTCSKTDIPKIVGKQGRNINSLKILCSAISAKAGYRFNVVINE